MDAEKMQTTNGAAKTSPRLIVLGVLLAAGVFVLDLWLPLGVAGGVPYVVLVLIFLWSPRRHHIMLAALAGTALTVLRFFLSPPGSVPWVVLTNRFLAVFAIWVIALLSLQRKQREEALSEMASIVESSDDAIIGKTLGGMVVSWNPGAERIYGYSAWEIKWRPISILIPPDRPDEVPAILSRIKRGERIDHYETVQVRKDGQQIHVSLTVSPVKNAAGQIIGASVIGRDVTERKQAEEELRQHREHLEELVEKRTAELAAANKELEAFTYSVSHDLRAPLRHIDGFANILVEDLGPNLDAEARHHLQRIQEGTRQMGQLVDDLLNLARVGRQELKHQVTGLNSLVKEALRDLQPETQGREIEWRIRPLPFVECDPALMKQVFSNLLANAVKFTRPRSRAVIEVDTTTQNGLPVVFVRDNGVGFSMKYAEKLFGVFQRLHRTEDFEGTGVGLATVQRIVRKHGGRIWAEAELDQGATFYFTLPTTESTGSEEKTTAAIGGQ